MQVSILTVGDELLAGDIVNTNASWLAARLTERGVRVREIRTVPDEIDVIARQLSELHACSDAVIVTGGVGGTPDDITMDAVAEAFDSPLEIHDEAREDVVQTIEQYDRDIDVDIAAWSALPADARPIRNTAGLSPGCVIEDVYVLPGIPAEMKPMFDRIEDEFAGSRCVQTARSSKPESELVADLNRVIETFDVSVGSYPEPDGGEKRIVIRGDDDATVEAACEWLRKRV